LAFVLFFVFAYAGYHTLLKFGYYADLASKIVDTGLWLRRLLRNTYYWDTDGPGIRKTTLLRRMHDRDKSLGGHLFTHMVNLHFGNSCSVNQGTKGASSLNLKSALIHWLKSWYVWIGYWSAMTLLCLLIFSTTIFGGLLFAVATISFAFTITTLSLRFNAKQPRWCYFCGNGGDTDAKYCQYCGKTVGAFCEDETTYTFPNLVCPVCGYPNNTQYGARFCKKRGKPLQ
jgi:hypothetical protein